MVRTDRQKSLLESVAELRPNGSGILKLTRTYDSTQVENDGFVGSIPQGLEVKRMGEYGPSGIPMAEFLIWDPTKVDVVIDTFEGIDETEAVNKAHAYSLEGYHGEIRPYRGHFTVWGQRPALIRAETPPTT